MRNTAMIAALIAASGSAGAQVTPTPVETPPLSIAVDPASPTTGEVAAPAEAALNPDEMAAFLNSQQQIHQTYTLTRTVNGRVVDTEQRTVTFSPKDPLLPTEAGQSPMQRLKAQFDREVLARGEALDEAKLDFVIADADRNGLMTTDEFVSLVAVWRSDETRKPAASDATTARERQYQEFIDELDPQSSKAEIDQAARRRFGFMAGARPSLSRQDYIREYLLDFDAMDKNGDGLLRDAELVQFRAINRGETETPPAQN